MRPRTVAMIVASAPPRAPTGSESRERRQDVPLQPGEHVDREDDEADARLAAAPDDLPPGLGALDLRDLLDGAGLGRVALGHRVASGVGRHPSAFLARGSSTP